MGAGWRSRSSGSEAEDTARLRQLANCAPSFQKPPSAEPRPVGIKEEFPAKKEKQASAKESAIVGRKRNRPAQLCSGFIEIRFTHVTLTH